MSSLIENDLGDFLDIDPKDMDAAEFVSYVGQAFQEAFAERKLSEKMTMQQLATAIGVDRSRVHRMLSGSSNLTATSMAEIAWALRKQIVFKLIDADNGGFNEGNYAPSVAWSSTVEVRKNPPTPLAENSPLKDHNGIAPSETANWL